MEFADVGCHCQYPQCGRQDFLPFHCEYCKKSYCLAHKDYSSHECPDYKDPSVIYQPKKKKKKSTRHRCCFENCKNTNMVPINCMKCHKNYCLDHRYAETHNCISLINTKSRSTKRMASSNLNPTCKSSSHQKNSLLKKIPICNLS